LPKGDVLDKLRILNLEDNQDDFELIRARLRHEGIECDLIRVETKADFISELNRSGFDLILSDYLLPSFDGSAALKIAKGTCPEVPFIFVSGAIGEENAIESLKQGATDYVLKDRLSRLAPAINRAIVEAETHAKRRQAEEEIVKYHIHLEELVRKRTDELNEANEELRLELAERQKAQEALSRREREFEALAENVPDIVQRFDKELRHLYINPAVERFIGIPHEAFIGRTYRGMGLPENIVSLWDNALRRVFDTGQESIIEIDMQTHHGRVFLEARLVPEFAKDGSIDSVLAISRDITDRKNLEEKLHEVSITDELTGLLNRRGFLIFAQKQIELAKRHSSKLSILFVDLNKMKRINDEFGHKEGDLALVDTSHILRKTFRESDIIARIGGDEFTVLMPDPPDFPFKETVIRHVEDNLRTHNELAGKPYMLSASMGMVYYDQDHPVSLEELLSRADALMYEHKLRHYHSETPPKGKRERAHERHETCNGIQAEIALSGSHMIKNISVGGVSVRTSQRLSKNTVYRIRLTDGLDEEFSVKGVLAWSSLIGLISEKYAASPYYEAGLRFVELDEGLARSVEQFISDITK
jgi:diguanylate cyclase (GGDEF)-like protein/PAS domain S-box-containing protein